VVRKHFDISKSGNFVSIDNRDPVQPLQWAIKATGKNPVVGLNVTINGEEVAKLLTALPPRCTVKYSGGEEAIIYDPCWKEIDSIDIDSTIAKVIYGGNVVSITCIHDDDSTMHVELKTAGEPVRIVAPELQKNFR
jgi:hypothetical protein